MSWLVTGAAGFIGFHTARQLLSRGVRVVGIDNLNSYYDASLKRARIDQLKDNPDFTFVHADIADKAALSDLFSRYEFERIVHLAAQAGVRYALENPDAYIHSNIVGFQNLIDHVRAQGTEHFVYASTSSVYGANTRMPFSTSDNVDHPLSLYAATKKSNEMVAHTYAYLFGMPCTGLRFFTVYGPWGRPDMALFTFVRKILAGEPIEVFNEGRHKRDFTYVDDIVDGVLRVAERPAAADPAFDSDAPDPATSSAPWRVYNIGNNQPVALMDFIAAIETALGRKAEKLMRPLQPGDVPATYADIEPLRREFGFEPRTSINEGVEKFVAWYRDYHGV